MYRQMVAIRAFEERVNDLYTRALMPGLAHLYIGEEAVAVGVCEALRADDYITSTHRGHGHCLAKGAAPDLMFAELLGKEAGYCKGKGGSMHIADPATGNLGANAIVGGGAGLATGAAYASKMLGQDRVAVCFFGEGALGQGVLDESMNLAQLWKLPVIYVCENNMYNEYTHYSETTAGDILARRRRSVFRSKRWTVRTFARSTPRHRRWWSARAAATARLPADEYLPVPRPSRRRHRARLLPIETGRAAVDVGARSVTILARWLDLRRPRGQGDARSRSRTRWRPRWMPPSSSPERAVSRSGAGRRGCLCLTPRRVRASEELTFGEAIREALAEEMRRDSTRVLIGEDVAEAGTPFKVVKGLVEEFGKDPRGRHADLGGRVHRPCRRRRDGRACVRSSTSCSATS